MLNKIIKDWVLIAIVAGTMYLVFTNVHNQVMAALIFIGILFIINAAYQDGINNSKKS